MTPSTNQLGATSCALLLTLCMGCSGGAANTNGSGSGTASDGAGDGGGGQLSLLDRCKTNVAQAKATIQKLEESSDGVWQDVETTLTAWETSDQPCLAEGDDQVQRKALYKQTNEELHDAIFAGAKRDATAYSSTDAEKAYRVVRWAYLADGELADSGLRDLIVKLTAPRDNAMLAKFKEQKTYAQTAEGETVCIFAPGKIDPTEPISLSFQSALIEVKDVHVLCRSPKPVDTYATEGDANIYMVLYRGNHEGPRADKASEVSLGTLGKWENTTFFRGRFSMPQGHKLKPKTQRGYYEVTLELRRGSQSKELAAGSFYWHR